jgi:hypothetical protein
VQRHIQFWYGGEPIPPPWNHPWWHEAWKKYEPSHAPVLSSEELPYSPGCLARWFQRGSYNAKGVPPQGALEPMSLHDYADRIGYFDQDSDDEYFDC